MFEYSFWDNEGSQAIPQYQVYNIVKDYLNGGEIKDGACITEEGKKRKVLFIGWDGARADAMLNLFYDSFSTNGYNYPVSDYIGLGLLKDKGGLYIAYAGGEKGTGGIEPAHQSDSDWRGQEGGRTEGAGSQDRL